MGQIQIAIQGWLKNGGSFDEGMTLLEQVNRNRFYLDGLRRSRRESTLRYELEKVLRKADIPVVFERKKIVVPVKNNVAPIVMGKKGDVPKTDERKAEPLGDVTKKEDTFFLKNNRSGVVIRNEFPFLEDADCPEELKILVADMITAHSKYVKGHDLLFEVAHKGDTACLNAARQTVENYLENRRIWAELEHYKKTKTLLGEHPIFSRRKKEAELLALDAKGLRTRIKNLERSVKYREKLIKEKDSSTDVYSKQQEIKTLKEEIALIKKRLNDGTEKKRIRPVEAGSGKGKGR